MNDLQNLKAIRSSAIKELEKRMSDAYAAYSVEDSIAHIEERLVNDLHVTTDKLLGIDRRWSDIEIKEGRLRAILDPEIDRILSEKIKPLMEAEIARVMELQTIQKAIKKAIKDRIDSALYGITRSNSEIGACIDKAVNTEIDTLFKEWTASIETK